MFPSTANLLNVRTFTWLHAISSSFAQKLICYLRMLDIVPYNAHRAWLGRMGKRKHQDEDSDNEEDANVKKQKTEQIAVDEETPRLVYMIRFGVSFLKG